MIARRRSPESGHEIAGQRLSAESLRFVIKARVPRQPIMKARLGNLRHAPAKRRMAVFRGTSQRQHVQLRTPPVGAPGLARPEEHAPTHVWPNAHAHRIGHTPSAKGARACKAELECKNSPTLFRGTTGTACPPRGSSQHPRRGRPAPRQCTRSVTLSIILGRARLAGPCSTAHAPTLPMWKPRPAAAGLLDAHEHLPELDRLLLGHIERHQGQGLSLECAPAPAARRRARCSRSPSPRASG